MKSWVLCWSHNHFLKNLSVIILSVTWLDSQECKMCKYSCLLFSVRLLWLRSFYNLLVIVYNLLLLWNDFVRNCASYHFWRFPLLIYNCRSLINLYWLVIQCNKTKCMNVVITNKYNISAFHDSLLILIESFNFQRHTAVTWILQNINVAYRMFVNFVGKQIRGDR